MIGYFKGTTVEGTIYIRVGDVSAISECSKRGTRKTLVWVGLDDNDFFQLLEDVDEVAKLITEAQNAIRSCT